MSKNLTCEQPDMFRLARNHFKLIKVRQMDPEQQNAQNVNQVASNQHNEGKWTSTEHQTFLQALELYDNDWKKISQHVKTRNPCQVRSHAQKYYNKQQSDAEKIGVGKKVSTEKSDQVRTRNRIKQKEKAIAERNTAENKERLTQQTLSNIPKSKQTNKKIQSNPLILFEAKQNEIYHSKVFSTAIINNVDCQQWKATERSSKSFWMERVVPSLRGIFDFTSVSLCQLVDIEETAP